MKVLLIGGGGVFGSRLADLLARDGHELTLAGRRAPVAVADALGARSVALDRQGDLSALARLAPEVVIDAAGPFHAYGRDPYRLARAALAAGAHYIDLADDAAFYAGIIALDADARAAGVFALSGASSVPDLSSVVVAALSRPGPIDLIESAILPGNRAPRGRSVVESILHQAGTPMTQTVDGRTVTCRSWSDPRSFAIAPDDRRRAYTIRVPDQSLFPARFGAATVRFHAGLELAVMNRGLALLSRVRAATGLRLPDALIHLSARALGPFGTDTGGMVVRVIQGRSRRDWILRVAEGQGPFIPGVLARAILRDPGAIVPGARPALAEVTLGAIDRATSDLAVTTTRSDRRLTPLFARALGDDFDRLPGPVRALHDLVAPRFWSGRAVVTRGTGPWPRLLAALFGFPPATEDCPVTVTLTPTEGGETWTRRFGSRVFRSHLALRNGRMTERFGALTFDLDLHLSGNALHFPVTAARLGPVPLPRWALPRSVAAETEDDTGRFRFDVAIHAPLTGGLIVRYRGWLTRDGTKG